MEYNTQGTHIIADLYGVSSEVLNDDIYLERIMKIAVAHSGATVISIQKNKFEPQGVTILFLLSESHFSIHTYPEHGYVSIDAYTCGEHVDTGEIIDMMLQVLDPTEYTTKYLVRGVKEFPLNKQ